MAMNNQFTGEFNGFLSYTPVVPTGPAAPYSPSSTASEKSSDGKSSSDRAIGGLDAAMVKQLYMNGLESDVREFLTDALWAIENAFNPLTGKADLNKYKIILPRLARITAEKKQFEDAYKAAEQKNALGEIAITNDGKVFVVNKKEGIVIRDLANVNSETDHILSNGELATFRMSDARGAFSSEITNIVANGIGMTDVTKYILDVVSKLGTTETSNDGYVNRQNNTLKAGIEYLQSLSPGNQAKVGIGTSLNGIYKVNNLTLALASQAEAALEYILNTMPANMKTLLKHRANGLEEGIKLLTATLINSKLSSKSAIDLDYKGPEEKVTKDSSGKDTDKFSLDNVQQFLAGYGDMQVYKLNIGNSYSIYQTGLLGTLNNDKVNLKSGDSLKDVQSSDFGGVLQWQSVTMGGEVINDAQLDRVVIGSPLIVRMALPVDIREKLTTGVIKPDLAMLKRLEAADTEVREKFGTMPSEQNITQEQCKEINEIYVKHNLLPKYNNGKLNTLAYTLFVVIAGSADLSAFSESMKLEIPLLDEVEDENTRAAILRALKSHDSKYSPSSGFLGVGKTHIYQGSIFIPLINNPFNASQGSHNYFKDHENNAQNIEALRQLNIRVLNILGMGISKLD